MYINNWLIFSYTLPAKNPNSRVKVWRRLQALGAVPLKSSLYVLPFNEANYEHFQWLTREVEEMEGEAVFFHCADVENVRAAEIKALFARVRAEDYDRLNEEIRGLAARIGAKIQEPEEAARELQSGWKKFTRKFQAIQEIDFFPTGQGERTAMLLASLAERLQALTGQGLEPAPLAQLKVGDYQGKTWVTRKQPYIDRLASFWLVKRFLDSGAKIEFISPKQRIQQDPQRVYFDLAGGEFTHREGLITFEVLLAAFGLADRGLTHLTALIRVIDLKEDLETHEEAKTLKDLVDGLVKITLSDLELVERTLLVFDALYAAYQGGVS